MISASSARLERGLRLVVWLAPLVIGLLLSLHSLSSRDIWLHNRVGREFLAGAGIPGTNRYSFTEPEHSWTDHEWLFQTLVTVVDRLDPATVDAGAADLPVTQPGVIPWHAMRVILGLLLMFWLVKEACPRPPGTRRWMHPPPAWLGLPLLLGLHLLWPRLILRPELLSYLFFVWLVRDVERSTLGFDWGGPALGGKLAELQRPALLLNPLTPPGRAFLLVLLWAQFHGFAALAPVIWLLGGLLATWQVRLPGWRTGDATAVPGRLRLELADLALVLVFCLLALLLTPNGFKGLTYPLQALGQFQEPGHELHRLIAELVPLFESPQSLHGTLGFFKVSVVWGCIWLVLAWGKISLLRLVLWGLAGAAALAAQRNIGFYALTFIMLHTGAARDPRPWWWSRFAPARLQMPATCLFAVLTVSLACLWGARIVSDRFYLNEGVARRFGGGLTPAQFPVELAPAVRDRGAIRLVANVDGAGFLIDQAPRAKVFIDGRTEAYSPGTWQEYALLRAGRPDVLPLLAERRAELVALTVGNGAFLELARILLADERWRLREVGEASLLFEPVPAVATARDSAQFLAARLAELEAGLFADEGRRAAARLADRAAVLAQLWGLADRVDRQEALLRWGLALVPDHSVLAHNLGTLLLDRRQFQEALTLFQAAAVTNRRADSSLLNAGVCQFRLGRIEQAAQTFGSALRINPRRLETSLNLATTQLRLNDRQEAVRTLRRALDRHPGHAGLQRQITELEARRSP